MSITLRCNASVSQTVGRLAFGVTGILLRVWLMAKVGLCGSSVFRCNACHQPTTCLANFSTAAVGMRHRRPMNLGISFLLRIKLRTVRSLMFNHCEVYCCGNKSGRSGLHPG